MNRICHATLLCCFILTIATSNSVYADGWLSKGWDLLRGGLGGTEENTEQSESSSTASSALSNILSNDDLASGFKQALELGSEKVVAQLGATDGFNADELIHIPLPESMQKARSLLEKVGMESLADDLELKLNRAAEAAVPEAKTLFVDAIKSMTFDDIKAIYEGENDAATQYFREKMSTDLSQKMQPIIDQSLSEVGAISAYDQMLGNYSSIPFVPDLKANLNDYVLEKGMDGMFYYLAEEEKAIREDPVKRTTELLERVFGS